MAKEIRGLQGQPSPLCGINFPVVYDTNTRIYGLAGAEHPWPYSPIDQMIFDDIVKEGGITKLPEYKIHDESILPEIAVLHMTRPFIDILIQELGIQWDKTNNTAHYKYDKERVDFLWAPNANIWFTVDKRSYLCERMNPWTEGFTKRYDEEWHSSRDTKHLLDLSELIIVSAINKELRQDGYLRLGLAYLQFEPLRAQKLHHMLVRPDLGLTYKEFQERIKSLEDKISLKE